MDSVEIHNAKEEVLELINGSLNSGFSKILDPVFKATKNEALSSRSQILNLQAGVYSNILYKSTLCMGPDKSSLSRIPISKAIRKARKVLVEAGSIPVTDDVKRIVEIIQEYLKE